MMVELDSRQRWWWCRAEAGESEQSKERSS
jgi:hypothetical protein